MSVGMTLPRLTLPILKSITFIRDFLRGKNPIAQPDEKKSERSLLESLVTKGHPPDCD